MNSLIEANVFYCFKLRTNKYLFQYTQTSLQLPITDSLSLTLQKSWIPAGNTPITLISKLRLSRARSQQLR